MGEETLPTTADRGTQGCWGRDGEGALPVPPCRAEAMPRWTGRTVLPGESKPGWAPWEQQAHVPWCVLIVPACRSHARRAGAGVGLGMHMAGLWELTHGRTQSPPKEPRHCRAAGHLCLPCASRHRRGIAGLHSLLPAASEPLCPGMGTALCHSGAVKPGAPLRLAAGLSCGLGERGGCWGWVLGGRSPTGQGAWGSGGSRPGPGAAVHVMSRVPVEGTQCSVLAQVPALEAPRAPCQVGYPRAMRPDLRWPLGAGVRMEVKFAVACARFSRYPVLACWYPYRHAGTHTGMQVLYWDAGAILGCRYHTRIRTPVAGCRCCTGMQKHV